MVYSIWLHKYRDLKKVVCGKDSISLLHFQNNTDIYFKNIILISRDNYIKTQGAGRRRYSRGKAAGQLFNVVFMNLRDCQLIFLCNIIF